MLVAWCWQRGSVANLVVALWCCSVGVAVLVLSWWWWWLPQWRRDVDGIVVLPWWWRGIGGMVVKLCSVAVVMVVVAWLWWRVGSGVGGVVVLPW